MPLISYEIPQKDASSWETIATDETRKSVSDLVINGLEIPDTDDHEDRVTSQGITSGAIRVFLTVGGIQYPKFSSNEFDPDETTFRSAGNQIKKRCQGTPLENYPVVYEAWHNTTFGLSSDKEEWDRRNNSVSERFTRGKFANEQIAVTLALSPKAIAQINLQPSSRTPEANETDPATTVTREILNVICETLQISDRLACRAIPILTHLADTSFSLEVDNPNPQFRMTEEEKSYLLSLLKKYLDEIGATKDQNTATVWIREGCPEEIVIP